MTCYFGTKLSVFQKMICYGVGGTAAASPIVALWHADYNNKQHMKYLNIIGGISTLGMGLSFIVLGSAGLYNEGQYIMNMRHSQPTCCQLMKSGMRNIFMCTVSAGAIYIGGVIIDELRVKILKDMQNKK